MSENAPSLEEQRDALLAMFRQHQYQGKKGKKQERGSFEVVPAVKEMIPNPDALRNRHGAERDRAQDQKKAPDPHED